MHICAEEHEEIKRLVLDAGKTSVDKPEYATVIERAVTTFLTHAKEEEDEQHPIMRARLSPENSDVCHLDLPRPHPRRG